MSLLEISPAEITAFKFENNEKIIKTSLQSLVNQDNKTIAFIEMQLFGISHVYSLIDFSKVKKFNYDSLLIDTYRKHHHETTFLSLSKIIGDCPIEEGINKKSNRIILDLLDSYEWIMLYQLKNIISGMNELSDEREGINYDLSFEVDDGYCIYDLEKINFDYSDKIDSIPFNNYKYILKYGNGDYEFCNTIYNDNFEGIFVKIPLFNCWQYLSKKKYMNLKKVRKVDIIYATTNSPRCFSEVGYHQEYNMDNVMDILLYSIYIPMDIYFSKIFQDTTSNFDNKIYDAIEISIKGREYQTTLLLTHDELGIDKIFGTKNDDSTISNTSNYIKYMDRFCLLKLINKIILLKP